MNNSREDQYREEFKRWARGMCFSRENEACWQMAQLIYLAGAKSRDIEARDLNLEKEQWRDCAEVYGKEISRLKELVRRAIPSMQEYSNFFYDCKQDWLTDANKELGDE